MKEQYIVSARKYRPDSFETMVGQGALTLTLQSAILSSKTAHAYLFCGPRGVGKTSMARVFAKTINCLQRQANGEACNQCESCMAFNQQRSLNIYELDAASNNGVDDIRQLVEQVQVSPQIGRYKVYIIDEVHMLSSGAFNAFLKTLEEPPAYVIFILATTEKHKVLPTILSRCQIYDFKRISVADIATHLATVARREGIEAEAEALGIIAEKADGGMRDALSMFDRIANFAEGHITYDTVIRSLNILDYEYYFNFVAYFISGDYRSVLLCLDELLDKGFDAAHIINGLASFIRDLLMAHSPETIPLLQKSEAIAQRYVSVAKTCSPAFLYRTLALIGECDKQYKTATNKRLLVELCLMNISMLYSSELKTQPVSVTASTQQVQGSTAQPSVAKDPSVSVSPSSATVSPKPSSISTTARPTVEPVSRPSLTSDPTATASVDTSSRTTDHQSRPASVPRAMGGGSRSGIIRLDGAQAEEESSDAEDPLPEEMIAEFSDQDLQIAWISYASTRLGQSIHQRVIMEECLPIKTGANEITVELINKGQQEKLQADTDLLRFLQKELLNSQISMKFVVSEHVTKRLPTTTEEKISMLKKENPLSASFFEAFELQPL